jgi:hypothetical protein
LKQDGGALFFHAFLFSGTLQDLGTINDGGCESAALSLNALHVVVGWSKAAVGVGAVDAVGGIQKAFVWQHGTMQALPNLLQPDRFEEDTANNTSSASTVRATSP